MPPLPSAALASKARRKGRHACIFSLSVHFALLSPSGQRRDQTLATRGRKCQPKRDTDANESERFKAAAETRRQRRRWPPPLPPAAAHFPFSSSPNFLPLSPPPSRKPIPALGRRPLVCPRRPPGARRHLGPRRPLGHRGTPSPPHARRHPGRRQALLCPLLAPLHLRFGPVEACSGQAPQAQGQGAAGIEAARAARRGDRRRRRQARQR